MRLYVGNLSYDVTERELRDTFAHIGELTDVKLVTDRATGKSKGFGFVEFANVADGRRAIKELDGLELRSRAIRVNQANRRQNSNGNGRRCFLGGVGYRHVPGFSRY